MSQRPGREATYAKYYEMPHQDVDAANKTKTWITRAANFLVTLTEVEPGSVLERKNQADEYMIILPPGVDATVEAGDVKIDAKGDSLFIAPPGASKITAKSKGLIARIITTKAVDLVEKAHNKAIYADGAPEITPIKEWPAPNGGFKLRHYDMSKHLDPKGPRIQPRCYRSTNMMVNIFGHYFTRRDTTNLSPHWHDDFEQVSLCLHGNFIHHMRWPQTANLADWKADENFEIGTPSATVIPATVIHTSRDFGPEDGSEASLYDIFAPPRFDFARKKGFVLNENDYPMPDWDDGSFAKGTLLDFQKTKTA